MKRSTDDYQTWGRERLILLQLGYVLLTMKSGQLSAETRNLFDQPEFKDKIGTIALKMAELDDQPSLMIAERIYSYVMTQDDVAFLSAKAAGDPNSFIFKDPLVFSRYASSLFLQDRFGQAKSVLDQILYTPEWRDMISSGDILKFDVSQYEMYMRHSQYALFRSYQEDDKIVDNIKFITRDLESIAGDISRYLDVFDEKHFRAVCWSYVVTRYLYCINSIIPSFYKTHEPLFINYLRKHFDDGLDSSIRSKPEVICADCLLRNINSGELEKCISDAVARIKADDRYPRSARTAFIDILSRVQGDREKRLVARPKAFFSYSHMDKRIADRVIAYLIDANVDILSDKQFIAGESLLSGMEQAILNAEVAIIFVSKNYLASEGWLQKERETIFARNVKGENALIVLTHDVSVEEVRRKFPMLVNNLLLPIEEGKIEHQIFKLSETIYKVWEETKEKAAKKNKR